MEGRLAMLAFIAAVAGVQTLSALPPVPVRLLLAGLVGAAMLLFLLCRRAGDAMSGRHMRAKWFLRTTALCACAASGGALYAIERGQSRLDDTLPVDQENQVARATLRVVSLAEFTSDAVRFDAEVIDAEPAALPGSVRITWPLPIRGDAAAQQSVMPGQRWRAAFVLKRPHAAMNPYAADGEARMFQRNVRATATLRGRPRLVEDEGWRLGIVATHRARHVLRERMRALLGETRYGAVIIALALGDQAGVPREDWQIFNATGITHLVSISGLHVTLVAGVAGCALAWCWRRLRWRGLGLAEIVPAQLAGIAVALCVAWLYCLLAGWGVPARRTFFTLAVAGVAALARLPLSRSGTLLFAACVVVALDTWAPIAPGFWLSFGAVAAVVAWAEATRASLDPDASWWRKAWRGGMHAGRLQCVVTFSLIPVLAYLTQQVALASPLANAVAIPTVSFVVTPLALLCAALCALPITQPVAAWAGYAAQWVFGAMMQWVEWLAGHAWAVWDVAAPPAILLALAVSGIAWALLPPGMASRRWAWLLILPTLCWRPSRPAEGEWRLTALDVGQGGAVIVETARRTLVFDAGPSHRNGTDGAQRVIWPYLRARGIKRVDTLVLSHGDQDHAGGVDSLLRAVPVSVAYASFDLYARLRRDARVRGLADVAAPPSARRCEAGQAWEMDGVRFHFLHPLDASHRQLNEHGNAGIGRRFKDRFERYIGQHNGEAGARFQGFQGRSKALSKGQSRGRSKGKSKGLSNADGCVLLVQGRYHAALLPGDVGVAQERLFVDALPRVDVVVAPHHGSSTSSGAALVEAAQANHVIAQVGYLNRFRHPAPAVQRRWRRAGAMFWRTDHHGAVIAHSSVDGLTMRAQREQARRYWHAISDSPPP